MCSRALPPRSYFAQIELISGIYRAADFPFVLPYTRPTEIHERYIVIVAPTRIYVCIYICISILCVHRAYVSRRVARLGAPRAVYNKFSTNNKSAWWNAFRVRKQPREIASCVPRESPRILCYISSGSTGSSFRNWNRNIYSNS